MCKASKMIKHNTHSQYVIGLCQSLKQEKKKKMRDIIKTCIIKIVENNEPFIPSRNEYLESIVYKKGSTIQRLECDLKTLCPVMKLYTAQSFKTNKKYTSKQGHHVLSQFMRHQKYAHSSLKTLTIWFATSSWVQLNIIKKNANQVQLCSDDNGLCWTIYRNPKTTVSSQNTTLNEIHITLDYLFLYLEHEKPSKQWFYKDKTCKRFVFSYVRAMMDMLIDCAPQHCSVRFSLKNEAIVPKRAPFQRRNNALEGVNLTALRVSQGLPDLYESLGFYTHNDVYMLQYRKHNTRSCLSYFKDHHQTDALRKDIKSTIYGKKNILDILHDIL